SNVTQVTMIAAARLSAQQYGGMSRPCVLVGEYRANSYANLQDLWTSAVQEVDPLHPLIAGRQDLPRSAVETPRKCAGVVVAVAPPDVLPVDVGRRGGQFMTIVSLPEGVAENPDVAGPFLADCLVHGAGGVAFPSWPALANNRPLLQRLKPMLRRLSESALQIETPSPRFAILYEPLSPGTPAGGASAPYGFMPQPADREPGALMETLSRGSVFGFADVLSLNDLSPAILGRYQVLLAPSLFVVPPEAVQALSQYVAQGGVLVTDLGLDLASLGRLEEPWPAPLSQFLGIDGTTPVQYALFQYPKHPHEPMNGLVWYPQVIEPDLFPDLTPNALLSLKGEANPFSGPRSYVRIKSGADLSLFGYNPPATRDHTSASGIFVRQVGQGYVLFASFRLWSEWTEQSDLFPIFMGDLIGRGASSRLDEIGAAASSITFTPAANDDFTLLESGPTAAMGRVRIDGAAMPFRRGCIMQALPGSPPTSLAYADLEPQQPISCPTVPVTLVLQKGFVTTALDQYKPSRIVFEICGTGSSVKRGSGRLRIEPGAAADATITVQNGAYRVTPGSRHQAVVQDLQPGGHAKIIILQADADGKFSFSYHFNADRVEITPLAARSG
ncbi:MAG TPA: hypothetical protein VFJ58_20700, partial [Armatimonadota bacterium]|nr:hypothetical protein [Armatimonadota bacterium]